MRVAHLTIVYAADVDAKQAHHLTDEIAEDALSYEAVDAVRCDVAEFDRADIDAFNAEAQVLAQKALGRGAVVSENRLDSPRIAVWNAYHDMPEVLCIEDGDDWQEIRVVDLIRLIREELTK